MRRETYSFAKCIDTIGHVFLPRGINRHRLHVNCTTAKTDVSNFSPPTALRRKHTAVQPIFVLQCQRRRPVGMSFRKRAPRSPAIPSLEKQLALPPGTRLSTSSSAPITSTGLRTLDNALGGGLPLATLTLIAEDEPSTYHRALCSYIIAQGLIHSHTIAVASFLTPAASLFNNLPACVDAAVAQPHASRQSPDMEIAWRYQKRDVAPIVSTDRSRAYISEFDLSQPLKLPTNAAISSLGRGVSASLDQVLQQLEEHMKRAAKRRLLTRVVIFGLSDMQADNGMHNVQHLIRFLCQLRALTRTYGAVAIVTCPREVPFMALRASADAVLKIDSFGGRGAGIAGLGKEWLGVVIVEKTFRCGFGRCLRGKGDVWVFKRGRRKYVMERATAAPDLEGEDEEGGPGSKHSESNAEGTICGTGPKSSGMDF